MVKRFHLTRSGSQPGVAESQRSPVYSGRAGSVEVTATIVGVGPARSARMAELLVRRVGAEHVFVCGIAGGLAPHLQIGSVVVPEVVVDQESGSELRPSPIGSVQSAGTVLTVGELVLDAAELDRLRGSGVDALDMESAAVGRVCGALGVPWTVFRSISDHAHEGLVDDSVLGLLNEDGSVKFASAARLAVLRPRRVPALTRLARDSALAARSAAAAAAGALSGT